jgi:small subunit ribosomal protein S15
MEKKEIIDAFRQHDSDTGSCEVQIALLTDRIKYLTEHLKLHAKDLHSRRGLVALANKRRRLLGYIKKKSSKSYKDIIQRLGLRK